MFSLITVYLIQLQAPKPKKIECHIDVSKEPSIGLSWGLCSLLEYYMYVPKCLMKQDCISQVIELNES